MNLKNLSIFTLVIALAAGCSNNANEPSLTADGNSEGKKITLSVATTHEAGASQVSERKINGQAVTGSTSDIDHYCWQWSKSDKLKAIIPNPDPSKAPETVIFDIKECGVIYVDSEGKPCDKDHADKVKSHDGWATFEGTMPDWWEEDMEFDVYAGPEELPSKGYNVVTNDGLTNCMRFHGHVTDISKQTELIPQWTILIVTVLTGLRETGGEASGATQEAWQNMSWSYYISGIDILDSEDGTIDAEDAIKYKSTIPIAGTNTSSTADISSSCFFIINPEDHIDHHMLVRVNINDSQWKLTWLDESQGYQNLLEKNTITYTSNDFGAIQFGPGAGIEGGIGLGLKVEGVMKVKKKGA